MDRTSDETKHLVERELAYDGDNLESVVGVTVLDGIVTLSGTVSNWADCAAARRAAHRVAGVHDVIMEIRVKEPNTQGWTDQEIAHAVRAALLAEPGVPADAVCTTIGNGHVSLEGHVDSASASLAAESAARRAPGVVQLTNRLEIRPMALANDVRRAIESALHYGGGDGAHIGVDVLQGQVIVSGTIRNHAEKQAILNASRATPGVRCVTDRLHVQARG